MLHAGLHEKYRAYYTDHYYLGKGMVEYDSDTWLQDLYTSTASVKGSNPEKVYLEETFR